jgi:hypothetical protein
MGKRAQKNPGFSSRAQIAVAGDNGLMISELGQIGETTAPGLTDVASPVTIAGKVDREVCSEGLPLLLRIEKTALAWLAWPPLLDQTGSIPSRDSTLESFACE